jgi:hypothetical protein
MTQAKTLLLNEILKLAMPAFIFKINTTVLFDDTRQCL